MINVKEFRVERKIPKFIKYILLSFILLFAVVLILQFFEVIFSLYESWHLWNFWVCSFFLLLLGILYSMLFLITDEYHVKNNLTFLTRIILISSFLFQLSGCLFSIASNYESTHENDKVWDFFGHYGYWALALIFFSFPLILFSIYIQSRASNIQFNSLNALLLQLQKDLPKNQDEYKKIYDTLNNIGRLNIVESDEVDLALEEKNINVVEKKIKLNTEDRNVVKKEDIIKERKI
ncbi:MAG: hypothetical protein LBH55_02000 [Mycoplasmataceae bacterium]|nr:hypothetical protein [Mycoplasmataceae bacterium]